MSKINTNMAGVTTLYHMQNKEEAMNRSLERIASGLRINHAVDDAAGASLVNRMTSQIRGIEAAIRNAGDAISLTQTAEGALAEVSQILHRMRELSVQSANGVYTGQDRIAINNEVGQLQIELHRIAESSTFNNVKMLNGDFVNTTFQVGFAPSDQAILSIEDVKPTGLGEYILRTDTTSNAAATFLPATNPVAVNELADVTPRIQETENITIYGNVGTVVVDVNGGSTAKDVVSSVNAVEGTTGVYATAQTRLNLSFADQSSETTDTVMFNLYGKNTEVVQIAGSVDFGQTNGRAADLSKLAAAINNTTGKTGITATLDVTGSKITLLSNEGYDIVLENYELVNLSVPNLTVSGADHTFADAGNALDLVDNFDPNTVQVSGEVEFHSPFIYSVTSASVGTAADPDLFASNTPNVTSVVGTMTDGTYLVNLTNGTVGVAGAAGMTAQVTVASNAISAVQILNNGSSYTYGDTLTVDSSTLGATSGNVVFTIGSAASNSGVITNPGGFFSGDPSAAALTSVADLDVLTVLNSQRMMTAIDGALVRIDLERSDLGATMSRMEYTINNLSNISVNTQAARSRINDSDIAKETSELTKAQVLNQAAQAMLSQANRSSQAILGLLSDL
ncbi:flagellin [Alphaproteobacteria bacterium]|nr:flagellin [Alphaproteobacteria bacterium]